MDKSKSPRIKKEKIILGLDPGTNVMGYGVIRIVNKQMALIECGSIHLYKADNHSMKLRKIMEHVQKLINLYLPDEVAIEAPFYGKNPQSMLKLGRAQGVAIAAALLREIPVEEYAPKKIKQSVTGNGNASKEQVAGLLKSLLKFEETPKFLDATDALAVAVCHFFQDGKPVTKAKSWKKFLTDNPDRIG